LGAAAVSIPISEAEGIEVSARNTIRKRRREAGIALLISIFVLLLISVVAIALIVSSGTESALAGNYRSSTGVYYAALAGLEEARGRLLDKDPNSFKNKAAAGFLPAPGTQWDMGYVRYVLNPGPTEVAANILTTYPDTEYDNEFGLGALAAANRMTTPSVWNRSPLGSLNVPGPFYKWVRINAVSEVSLKLDVDHDTLADSTTPLYYDGIRFSNSSLVGPQVLEITSLATLPNGSQKLVQYLVAPVPITLPPFLGALTLSGSPGEDPVFHAPANNNGYAVKGDGWDCNGNPAGPPVSAINIYGDYPGSSSGAAVAGIKGGIPPSPPSPARWNYTGQGAAPDVEYVISSSKTPSQLNALAQTIIQSADAVVPAGNAATQTAYMNSLNMSPSNMLTVVANGDLDLTHWGKTGYGLLLVTGNFTMDPDNGWRGIILVIGQGKINNTDNTGSREIDGAVFVAKTRNSSGVALPDPNLEEASVIFDDNMGGTGIRYSNCWIQKAQPIDSYRVLSFHEIPQ